MTTITMTDRRLARAARRAETLDNYRLAEEVARHAAVAARHLSRAEAQEEGSWERDSWLLASESKEIFFLAEVDEARKRLAGGNADDLASWLNLFGATDLVR